MRLDFLSLFAAGVALGLVELLFVLTTGRTLFLSHGERLSYAVAALTALPALVFALGLVLRPALSHRPRARFARLAFGAVALVGAGRATWLLTEGRRVRELAVRPLAVAALALVSAALVVHVLARGARVRHAGTVQSRRLWTAGCGVVVLTALALDLLVLPRGYPAFHVSLSALALTAAALAPRVWWLRAPARFELVGVALVALCCLLAPWLLHQLAIQPNASFAVAERAPWTGKLLRLATVTRRAPDAKRAPERASAPHQELSAGIDLRDQDVLLVTVDALRADMLAPYGGTGRTPELDGLARESVVFGRAYTPAPHTSYALTSLLTAKFMKPVVELPGASGDHTTLPDILRRYGYRTAAFYPPAIFFVDGARFQALSERGFGFEYQKQMYAPAPDRVKQVEAYLAQAEAGHPLFVWVHLFEPHEPYDPPASLVREDSARGRYDGEVALCDTAIGDLVRAFREKRPGATVIVTADHGEEFGDHGGSYHGTTLYDEQARVPLLWSSPGKVTPGRSDAPVELVDVGTTLLSALGMPRDARMRGDDLGAVLRDHTAPGPPFAFASVEDRHMATDGRFKALCAAHEAHCQLFDLREDPRERTNLAVERPEDVARLRAALDAFLSTIPRVEALAVSDGVGFPEALARARLGAPGAGPDVVPLLGDARASIRAAAARVLGELEVRAALPMLTRVRAYDPDADVRAEAAIAALLLGDLAAADQAVPLLGDTGSAEHGLARAPRAALALAHEKRLESIPGLSALALDPRAQEVDRARAVAALGALGTQQVTPTLAKVLEDVRLRPEAAAALGHVGGRRAADALARALQNERYQPARRALARALFGLRDPRTRPLVERFLGMETSLPDGVRILLDLGALDAPSGRGARLANPAVRNGTFTCEGESCTPGEGAVLTLPARAPGAGPVRVTFLVTGAEPGAQLLVDGVALPVKAREDQVSLVPPSAKEAQRFALGARGTLGVVAAFVTKAVPEIPPPPPEPWQADEP